MINNAAPDVLLALHRPPHAARIERLTGTVTRTVVVRHVCPLCEGFGIVREQADMFGRRYVPVAMEKAQSGDFVCWRCLGVGATYQEEVR